MGLDHRVRGDVRCREDVARQPVAVAMHLDELQRRGQCGHAAIGIGDQADSLWPCTDAAQIADDPERGRVAARALPLRARYEQLEHERRTTFGMYLRAGYSGRLKKPLHILG